MLFRSPAPEQKIERDISLRNFSNTRGISGSIGFKKTANNRWLVLRAGADSHADYQDGRNNRLLNSRFESYNFKAGFGKNALNHSSANRATVSFSRFGFVFDSITSIPRDARWSRSFKGPHHQVFLANLSSEQIYFRPGGTRIQVNTGLSTNLRQEDEGGGGISLSMLLNTASLSAQVSKHLFSNTDWIYGVASSAQTNKN